LGSIGTYTDPSKVDRPNNRDGERRHHLIGDQWKQWDSGLFEGIQYIQNANDRNLANFWKRAILPTSTAYFDEELAPDSDRSEWHRLAMDQLSLADLVFLDPDNGFEVRSMTRRTKPKYAMYTEARDYLQKEKIVVSIQFARQCDPVARGEHVREHLANGSPHILKIPVIRGRLTPNILFLVLSPESRVDEIREALRSFEESSPRFERNHKRVELIS
jgi:hypothetical protein